MEEVASGVPPDRPSGGALAYDLTSVLDGRYRLDEVLGHGGMAAVYRATDLRLGRDVAVKVFREDFAEAVDLRRIQREVTLLAATADPHVVGVLDAAEPTASGAKYLVMEYVDGTDLRHLLAARRLSPEFVRRIVADVATALQVLHAQGVVHRDVKPENVLIPRGANHRPRGIAAKLGDF